MRRILLVARRTAWYLTVALLGFLGGGAALYVAWLNSGTAVDLWHTVELESEFTAEDAESVTTFDDYLALEDRLFAELDDAVYARTPIGSSQVLARYSRNSAADPGRWEVNWNRSFELPAEQPAGGVLLLHGMSDSPYSLRAIGQALAARGQWVVGLRLPGHGTVPSGLKRVAWQDAAAAVRIGMSHLESKVGGRPVHVIGYSTGAPLAIEFTLAALAGTAAPRPASLVLVSPAIGVSPAAAITPWLVRAAEIPMLEKLAWTAILPEFDPFKYNSFTSNAGEQVHRLTRRVASAIVERESSGELADFPPTLVLLSTADSTVSVDAVIDNLLEHLPPGHHELVLFDINRSNVNYTLLVSDPGPLTLRLLEQDTLPFHFTLITNADEDSIEVVGWRKPALAARAAKEPLDLDWPRGMISLSHVSLPFPPDDPLYGRYEPERDDRVYLGTVAIQGERGLLRLPTDWLLRLRHNPFYDYLEKRTLDWIEATGRARTARTSARAVGSGGGG